MALPISAVGRTVYCVVYSTHLSSQGKDVLFIVEFPIWNSAWHIVDAQ